jgi:membrane-associated phospholipid phosphatase
VPAYLLAGVVGASRIQQDKHHLSDVLAGATLGYIVGRTTVRVNNAPIEGKRPIVTVSPILGRDTRGVMVAIVF